MKKKTNPPVKNLRLLDRIDRCIVLLYQGRHTHYAWSMEGKRPKEIGDVPFHESCVEMYDERIALMETFRSVVAALETARRM